MQRDEGTHAFEEVFETEAKMILVFDAIPRRATPTSWDSPYWSDLRITPIEPLLTR